MYPKQEIAWKSISVEPIQRLLSTMSAMLLTTILLTTTSVFGSSVLSLKEIRQAGVVTQSWDTSCGAAAIATVLTYHFEDPVSEQEVAQGLLRQTIPMKVRHRGGFSLRDMKRYVEQRGYRAIGFKALSFEELGYFDAPIVPVNFHGYNHYVVYRGLTPEGKVWLADPAFGNHAITRERFERVWLDGMAFTLLNNEN